MFISHIWLQRITEEEYEVIRALKAVEFYICVLLPADAFFFMCAWRPVTQQCMSVKGTAFRKFYFSQGSSILNYKINLHKYIGVVFISSSIFLLEDLCSFFTGLNLFPFSFSPVLPPSPSLFVFKAIFISRKLNNSI